MNTPVNSLIAGQHPQPSDQHLDQPAYFHRESNAIAIPHPEQSYFSPPKQHQERQDSLMLGPCKGATADKGLWCPYREVEWCLLVAAGTIHQQKGREGRNIAEERQ